MLRKAIGVSICFAENWIRSLRSRSKDPSRKTWCNSASPLVGKRQPWGRPTVHCQSNLGHQVIFCRGGLCTSNRAGNIGVTDTELIVVPSVWAEILGFDLRLLAQASSSGSDRIVIPSGCSPRRSLYTPCRNPPPWQRHHLMPPCS